MTSASVTMTNKIFKKNRSVECLRLINQNLRKKPKTEDKKLIKGVVKLHVNIINYADLLLLLS